MIVSGIKPAAEGSDFNILGETLRVVTRSARM